MALGHLSLSPTHFNDGDYYEETKFVKATPVEQHPKVKLNKFSTTKILNFDPIRQKLFQ